MLAVENAVLFRKVEEIERQYIFILNGDLRTISRNEFEEKLIELDTLWTLGIRGFVVNCMYSCIEFERGGTLVVGLFFKVHCNHLSLVTFYIFCVCCFGLKSNAAGKVRVVFIIISGWA